MAHLSPLSSPDIVANPYPVYAALREKEPVHWCDSLQAWALLRHGDCASALTDRRLKAERMVSTLNVKFPGRELAPDNIYHRFTKNVMMYTDPPLHDSLRRSTKAGFTPAAHDYYNQVIAQVAADLVASIANGRREIDGVADLAAKLPVAAAVRAFGVPEEDLDFVVPRVNDVMTYWSGPRPQPIALDAVLDRLTELHTYALELVQGCRGRVAEHTVIARLAGSQGGAECSIDQTIHQLVLLLIALFAPTTPGSASSGLLAFAMHPQEVERFMSDRACADNVANEVFRYNASNQFTWRVVGEPLEIGSVPLEAGALVVPFLGAANRDERIFDEPDTFSLSRKNSAQHLSFGDGLHACLGKHIASLEIRWFFAALFERYRTIRLAGTPRWNTNLEFRSLQSLPLSLG